MINIQGLEADSVGVSMIAAFVREIVQADLGVWLDEGQDVRSVNDPKRPVLVVGPMPGEPANMIGLTPYVVSMDEAAGIDTRAIQVRIRTEGTDPRPALILTDRLEELLHGRDRFPLRDGELSPLVWRNSVAVLGETDSGNYEITNNFYLYVENQFTQEAYYG